MSNNEAAREEDRAQLTDPIDFDDLQPISVTVRIRGREYKLYEASAAAAVKYRNAQLKATKLQDGKVSGVEGMANTEPLIVSLCLYEVTQDKNGATVEKQVTQEFVEKLPDRVMKRLYERLKKLSPDLEVRAGKDALRRQIADLTRRLREMEEAERDGGEIDDPAKNGQCATTPTSA